MCWVEVLLLGDEPSRLGPGDRYASCLPSLVGIVAGPEGVPWVLFLVICTGNSWLECSPEILCPCRDRPGWVPQHVWSPASTAGCGPTVSTPGGTGNGAGGLGGRGLLPRCAPGSGALPQGCVRPSTGTCCPASSTPASDTQQRAGLLRGCMWGLVLRALGGGAS